jgi:hypothetical protein
MKQNQPDRTFSKAHTLPIIEVQTAHGDLKKLEAAHKCVHRTASGFCKRSHRPCTALLLNNL